MSGNLKDFRFIKLPQIDLNKYAPEILKRGNMISILIADDHPAVRKGLALMITEKHKTLIEEAEDGFAALKKIRENKYNLVLLNISMPGLSGLDVLKQIKYEKIKVPVLATSVHSEQEYAMRVLQNGADGYLCKAGLAEELDEAVKKVLSGGKYISPALAEKLACELCENKDGPLHKKLSDREYQIMTSISSGKSHKEIEQELRISVKTISAYKARIFKKLNVKNDVQLTHYAIRNNLLPETSFSK